ncbi:MAG: aminotransferase class I/II-fold pyridoxal phosphate-dependent enzyme, partial [Planctomycetes bacterium]|nr:aminotransferase class I/II-fold pyridoxal phosphate-dependent enzyme [Planctomycetota bacterium]
AHFAEDLIAQGGGAAPPIHQSSTFVYPNAEAFERRRSGDTPYPDYTRAGNPTTAILEAKLARLEQGSWARCFASGMGAITAAINSVTHAGAHVVAVRQCYGPTHTYLTTYLNRFGVETTFVDSCDPAEFIAAMRDDTRLIYLESPTTGHFEVPEIEPITAAARARKIRTIFDNSWATPYFQTPLEMGCDLIVHSATKYIGGHSDLVAGAVIGRDEGLRERILREAELLGATLDPFASWLLIRGLRTLAVRMEHVQRSGLEIARMLESHPKVGSVNHPGLESHPQHATARKQMRGYASLFSFRLKDQSREATYRFIDRLELFQIGVSWGGHESLVVGGSLFSVDPAKPDWIIRLYVGLEATTDLLADIKRALED